MCSGASAKVQAAALRNWTLLLTTVPAGRLDSDFVEDNIKLLAALLHADDVEVRRGWGWGRAVGRAGLGLLVQVWSGSAFFPGEQRRGECGSSQAETV